jgi:hypothetical protein
MLPFFMGVRGCLMLSWIFWPKGGIRKWENTVI